MKSSTKRNYSMKKRAVTAQKTEDKILKGLYLIWMEGFLRDVTLDKVAERSGVTVRTILRKFGSKEGLFEAALNSDVAGIQQLKDTTVVGDIDSILDSLIEEYETTGMAMIRTLALEYEMEQAVQIIVKGRKLHKAWCERVFEPFLPKDDSQKRHEMLGAMYVETDVRGWKLLRVDLGYSVEETRSIMRAKIIGTLHSYTYNL